MEDLTQFEGEGSSSGAKRPGLPVDPARVRRALWHGKKLVVLGGIAGVLFGFAWVKLMMSDVYLSTAVLKYEGEIQLTELPPARYALVPLADALLNQSVLERIADEIGFGGSLTVLEDHIAYEADPRLGTIQITVADQSGRDAAAFARVVTDVFLEYHKDRQARRIEAEIDRDKRRIDAAEDELGVARERYDAFRQKHGIADLSAEQESTVSSAATLRADSELAESEIRALQAEVDSLEAQLKSIPKTSIVSEAGSPERATYDRLRLELATAKATLSPDHPTVKALEHQVAQLRSQLRSGRSGSNVGGGILGVNTTYQTLQEQLYAAKARLVSLRERQKGLRDMADKARARMEGFSDIEGEASALLHEVQVNENVLAELRRTEAGLEDALSHPPSGFVVLDPGAIPEYPEENKMKVVFFGAFSMLGLLIGVLLALRVEFKSMQVETPTEVAFWGNGPVLGATTWPDDPDGLDELVAGLDDLIPKARGSMLIVGASDHEARHAHELAARFKNDWFLEQAPEQPVRVASTRPPGAPLTTPPPSGPYPVGAAGSTSTALARIPPPSPEKLARRETPLMLDLRAWDGPREGRALRRAARLADRVLVIVRSGHTTATQLHGMPKRLGREERIGYVVIGLPDELHSLHDRVGDVAAFWQG